MFFAVAIQIAQLTFSLKDHLLFMIRDLTISNGNVKHLESSDAAVSQFLIRTWQSGRGRSRLIHHAISGEALWEVTSEGLDMAAARQFAIEKGAPALRAMTFIERAAMLKAVANIC